MYPYGKTRYMFFTVDRPTTTIKVDKTSADDAYGHFLADLLFNKCRLATYRLDYPRSKDDPKMLEMDFFITW
jgi:hypothetical protein